MEIEYELRILDIDKEKVISALEEAHAVKIGDFFQRRYVYDFHPQQPKKWIRLRTNGEKTTLTIKEVCTDEIDGTKEIEIIVSDFDNTNKILNELGYTHRAYQENRRITYMLDNVEIDIDTWPLIPTYLEIEGKSTEEVYKMVEKLKFDKNKVTTLDVQSIYEDVYKINVDSYKELMLSK